MARQAALLLLTIHGYEIPAYAVGHSFYRQALELDLRGKREYTEVVLSAMGGMGKMQFSQYKALLKLSNEALELADRYHIEEYRLRPILAVDEEFHVEIVRQIIDFNLSAKQIKELCEGDGLDKDTNDERKDLSPAAIKIAKVTQSIQMTSPQDLARALMLQEGNVAVAKARLQALRKLVGDAEQYLMTD